MNRYRRYIRAFFLTTIALTGYCPFSIAQKTEYPIITTLVTLPNKSEAHTALEEAFSVADQNPDSALALLSKLYHSYTVASYAEGMSLALLYSGMIYTQHKSDPAKGILYFRKSLLSHSRIQSKNKQWMADWYNSMGVAFYFLDISDSAVYYFEKALQLSLNTELRDTNATMIKYNNLSITLVHLNKYKEARYYLRRTELLGLKNKDHANLVNTYQGMALSYQGEKRFDSVFYYLRKVDNLGIKLNQEQTGLQHTLYGIAYSYTDQITKGIQHFKQAVASSIGSKKINYLSNLGAAYHLTRHYQEARKCLELAVEEARENKDQNVPKTAMNSLYANLSDLYDSLGDYRKAYSYRTLSYWTADSISQVEKNKVVHQIESQYRLAEKDKKIAEKDKSIAEKQVELLSIRQKLSHKNMWILSALGTALLLCFLLIVLYQRQRLKLQKSKTDHQQQQIDQLSAVLDGEEKERARIGRQLHDDVMVEFSISKINLATLPDEFPEIKTSPTFERIEQQLDKTGIKIRQTAHNLMPDALLTEGLLYAIGYFCSGVSKTANIAITFQHFGALPKLSTETEVNLYRIVQELVHNVVKHAAASEILVQLYNRDGIMSLTIDDNGKGIANLKKAEDGMGIKSIRSRLKVLGGEMDIRSAQPHGTAVHIEIG